jgi:hypothetical protein
MGQDSPNHFNNERFQTEYNNTMKEKEDNKNINVNKSYALTGIQNLNNNANSLNATPRKIFIGKKNDLTSSVNNSNKCHIDKSIINKKNILEQNSFLSKDIQRSNNVNNNIYSEYFKCISCPMCILIIINPKNNCVKITCENGHNNEMNIESFISIYKHFKYICDKCKKELSSKFIYCTQCKELFCESCLKRLAEMLKHKGHIYLSEKEVNFYCTNHKKKLVNFCNNCKKNCCKKCCSLHSSHELLLIKNEIREINNIEEIEKLLNKEKIIIEKIEEKYSSSFFKNQNPKYLKSFNKLLSFRKLEYQLKNKILTTYKNYINSIKVNENNQSINDLDISLSSISSNISSIDYGNNFLMNYYFLKTVNELENEILSNQSDFFNISEDNKYYQDFSELKQYLFNYKKNIISPEKNLDNFSKYLTIHQKPSFIFPLDDGNFIITYSTKIIFYDGLYGDELLVLDEEIFDYTYKIIKLMDDTLLFFGDFLNHVKICEDGDIKILFTGSHIEILKEIVLYDNNIVFIDKIAGKLNILTNKDINWHKEPFPEYSLCSDNFNKKYSNYNYDDDASFLHNESDINIDLNSSILTTYKNNKHLNLRNNTESKLNKSFTTTKNNQNTKELFLNSIKTLRQEKIKKKIKNNNIISNKIKTFDILSLNDSCFIALQERNINRNELCFRIFDYNNEDDGNKNELFKLMDVIHLEEEPVRKSGVLSLINNENNNYIGYGLNDKKFFVIFDIEKKIITTKIYLNFITYRFFGDILLFNYQNSIFQYLIKDNEFLYVTKIPFHGVINTMNYLKNYTLLIDNRKFTYMYSYRKNNDDNI